jgi:hypothetical protein
LPARFCIQPSLTMLDVAERADAAPSPSLLVSRVGDSATGGALPRERIS